MTWKKSHNLLVIHFDCQVLQWLGNITKKWGKSTRADMTREIILLASCIVCALFSSGVRALLLCLSEVGFNGWQGEQPMLGSGEQL